MQVKKRNGQFEPVSMDKILKRIEWQMYGLNRKFIEPIDIAKKVVEGLVDGISTRELDNLAVETAAFLISNHPDYSILASRIALSNLYKETNNSFADTIEYIESNTERLDLKLCQIVKKYKTLIDSKIDNSRDSIFDYFGFKTLEKSYLIRVEDKVVERPQYMWMRVSIGIWGENLEEAFKTYDQMSQGYFTHATPTLFNSGSRRPQMSSCFLIANKGDSLEGIMETCTDVAKISSAAGGIGLHVHDIRADGSHIHKSGGTSKGLLPLLRTYNELCKYWDQCFTDTTLVLTDSGYESISSLKLGQKVKTSDNSYNEIKVVKEFDYKGSLVVIKVNNNIIQVTPKHNFLVIKNSKGENREKIINDLKIGLKKVEWLEADQLTDKDVILTYGKGLL